MAFTGTPQGTRLPDLPSSQTSDVRMPTNTMSDTVGRPQMLGAGPDTNTNVVATYLNALLTVMNHPLFRQLLAHHVPEMKLAPEHQFHVPTGTVPMERPQALPNPYAQRPPKQQQGQ